MKGKSRVFSIVYFALFCLFFLSVLYLVLRCTQPSMYKQLYSDAAAFDSGWYTADGTPVDLGNLEEVEGTEVGKEFSIYHEIPANLQEGDSLYFRSKNIFYSVYLDGTLVYAPEVPESALYTNSFGTRWSCIPLSQKDAGAVAEIRVTKAYESSHACIDNIHLGDSGGLVMDTIYHRLLSFVVCLLLLFVGLILIVADIPANMQKQKNHELLYLGMFSTVISIWCFSETNLVQLYFSDSRMMQMISCGTLMMIGIPLMLYLDAAFGFRRRWIPTAYCGLSLANIVVCWGLHFLGIRDIHDTLTFTHVCLALGAMFLIYSIVRNFIVRRGEKHGKNIYRILRTIGLCGIGFAAVGDLIRYYAGSTGDRAMLSRIGLLIFILCYGSSSLENIITAVKRGAQAEFIRRLAYHDGLTGIGNRTAFQERLAALEKEKSAMSAIGVIMFDVNDLKFVNDNLGHAVGDQMLTKSARIIQDAFEPLGGDCFRIGGDEFSVLLSGEDAASRYKEGIAAFTAGIQAHNAEENKAFYLSIAYGYAEYNKDASVQKLDEVYTQADENMYETKKEMKSKRNVREIYAGMVPLQA